MELAEWEGFYYRHFCKVGNPTLLTNKLIMSESTYICQLAYISIICCFTMYTDYCCITAPPASKAFYGVQQMLHEWAMHDLGHIRQIAELVRAQALAGAGRLGEFYQLRP
jgi:hypothetical protein